MLSWLHVIASIELCPVSAEEECLGASFALRFAEHLNWVG
jgi:hypothetical protein